MNNLRIHIFGASGSGVSSLGTKLAQNYQIQQFEADDYFWQKTNPPFQKSVPKKTRENTLLNDISKHDSWILSGSMTSWCESIKPLFTMAIYLYVPAKERLKRLRIREKQRHGNRILKGGDMYEGHQAFIQWAEQYDESKLPGRHKAKHEEWMETLSCPIKKIEGIYDESELLEIAQNFISNPHS